MKARAVVLEGGGATRLQEVELPPAEPGDLVLELEVCGLCGTDLYKIARDTTPRGTVLGHELVGRVVAAEASPGAADGGLGIGDRVVVPHHVACGECAYCRRGSETLCSQFRIDLFAPGGFSERVVVRRRAAELAARKLPATLAAESAVFLEPAACVLRAIDRAGLPATEAIAAILGGGSMGLLHLLVLKALSPTTRVLVVEPVEDRRRLALELGADRVCGLDPDVLESAANEMARGELRSGVDAVFDTVGGGAIDTGLSLLREGGTIVLFAHDQEDRPRSVDLNRLFKSEQRLVGSYSGSLREQERIFTLLASGRLDPSPLVTHRRPLSRFDEAVELCRSRQALKVLLEPDR